MHTRLGTDTEKETDRGQGAYTSTAQARGVSIPSLSVVSLSVSLFALCLCLGFVRMHVYADFKKAGLCVICARVWRVVCGVCMCV